MSVNTLVPGSDTPTGPDDNWPEFSAALSLRLPRRLPDGSGASGPAFTPDAVPGSVLPTSPGVPSGDPASDVASGVVVRTFWWGFHVEIPHDDLVAILGSADVVNSTVERVGGSIPSPAQPWIILIAKFVAGVHLLLRALDQGAGIYLSMSWFAPGVFVPTSVPVGSADVAVQDSGPAPAAAPAAAADLAGPIHDLRPVLVNANPRLVDTGVMIEPGQRLVITAEGQIWSGVWFTGTNGPSGWTGWEASPDSPLPGAPPFSLIGKLGASTFFVGAGEGGSFTWTEPAARLLLGCNTTRFGTGAFSVRVLVFAA